MRTEDMIDREICDGRRPAKWQTSMAVFKFVPEDDDQLFPAYKITYLKVTATVTGYQPLDKEIQGTIDWDGVDVWTIPGLTGLLNSYNPCHGAILQVFVGPHEGVGRAGGGSIRSSSTLNQRSASCTRWRRTRKEKQSRSIESLNVTKSAGQLAID